MNVEDVVANINRKEMLVSSLYQDGENWHASLRLKTGFSDSYGVGKTIVESLERALESSKTRMTDEDWDALRPKTKRYVIKRMQHGK